MRRLKAFRSISISTSRSRDWTAKFAERYARIVDITRLHLLFQMPALARTLILLQQRWQHSSTAFQSQLNLSINRSDVFNAWSTRGSVRQLTLLKLAALAQSNSSQSSESKRTPSNDRSRVSERAFKTKFLIEQENLQHMAMTLALNRTSFELSTVLNRHVSLRREADIKEVTTLLTQRVRKVDDTVAVQTAMALRSPIANRVAAAQVAPEVVRPASSFERSSNQQSVQAVSMPPVNVELLADQVLKQIDRRVVARRERMGLI